MQNKTLTIRYLKNFDSPDISSLPMHFIDCDNSWQGNNKEVKSSFRICYNEESLHIIFSTAGAPATCRHFADLSAVCEDSCVEFFIQPSPDGEYFNFEFNVAGYLNASHRKERPNPVRLTAEELAIIDRQGNFCKDDFSEMSILSEREWEMAVTIPWKILGVVPRPGMIMRANFRAVCSAGNPPYYMSWSPIDTPKPDFHRPEFFGEIILGEKA